MTTYQQVWNTLFEADGMEEVLAASGHSSGMSIYSETGPAVQLDPDSQELQLKIEKRIVSIVGNNLRLVAFCERHPRRVEGLKAYQASGAEDVDIGNIVRGALLTVLSDSGDPYLLRFGSMLEDASAEFMERLVQLNDSDNPAELAQDVRDLIVSCMRNGVSISSSLGSSLNNSLDMVKQAIESTPVTERAVDRGTKVPVSKGPQQDPLVDETASTASHEEDPSAAPDAPCEFTEKLERLAQEKGVAALRQLWDMYNEQSSPTQKLQLVRVFEDRTLYRGVGDEIRAKLREELENRNEEQVPVELRVAIARLFARKPRRNSSDVALVNELMLSKREHAAVRIATILTIGTIVYYFHRQFLETLTELVDNEADTAVALAAIRACSVTKRFPSVTPKLEALANGDDTPRRAMAQRVIAGEIDVTSKEYWDLD